VSMPSQIRRKPKASAKATTLLNAYGSPALDIVTFF